MNLSDINKGEQCIIESLQNMDVVLQKRLFTLGFKVGSIVTMKQKTFFGGPCIIECKGKLLSLRKKDAATMEVRSND